MVFVTAKTNAKDKLDTVEHASLLTLVLTTVRRVTHRGNGHTAAIMFKQAQAFVLKGKACGLKNSSILSFVCVQPFDSLTAHGLIRKPFIMNLLTPAETFPRP